MRAFRFVTAPAAALLLSGTLVAQTPAPAIIRDVAAGQGVLVVKGDGSVVAWGKAGPGNLPAPVALDLPGKVRKVAVGGANFGTFTAYAVMEDGTVMAWGSNDEGQLGNGPSGAAVPSGTYPKPSPTPVKVTDLSSIVAIGAGNKHAVALRDDGTVWAWGWRDQGVLGDGEGKRGSAGAPVRVMGLEGVTQIAVGPSHTLALTRDGHVMAWGKGHSGELGTGTRDPASEPVRVIGLDNVVAIAAGNGGGGGNGVSGAVRKDGTVWMWGVATSGMMGNGAERPGSPDEPGGRVLQPTPVKGLTGVKSLAIGGGSVAALLGDGTLRMWGHNGYGENGSNSGQTYELSPVKTALTNVAAVYLSNMRSYAVRTDGTFWIWGFSHSPATGILAKHWKVPTRLDLP